MKKEIKLTQKQKQVLRSLNTMLEENVYRTILVSDLFSSMTAEKNIISVRWFDHTFNKLENFGLVKKETMPVAISSSRHIIDKVYQSYGYNLTDLGFKYLGIINPNKTKEEYIENIIDTLFK